MKIHSINSARFTAYGMVLQQFDYREILDTVIQNADEPEAGVFYCPSSEALEMLPVTASLRDRAYGGLDIQAGYVCGINEQLSALEYHRCCEILITAEDVFLLLGRCQDIREGVYDSAKLEAFLLPADTGIMLYGTTLHYTPISSKPGERFHAVIILPWGTNGPKPSVTKVTQEDGMLSACNKWLIAYEDSDEAGQGTPGRIIGERITLQSLVR